MGKIDETITSSIKVIRFDIHDRATAVLASIFNFKSFGDELMARLVEINFFFSITWQNLRLLSLSDFLQPLKNRIIIFCLNCTVSHEIKKSLTFLELDEIISNTHIYNRLFLFFCKWCNSGNRLAKSLIVPFVLVVCPTIKIKSKLLNLQY